MPSAAMSLQQASVDPITVEVIGSALSTIVEEMGRALIRSSYSTNIKERRDCSTAIFNTRGETIVQAEHIPVHLGSLLGIARLVFATHDLSKVRPGDVFIGNDAHTGGGTHLNDIVFLEPIFVDGALTAWVVNTAHHSDFVDRGHAHIFQEGLRIPPVKLYREGEVQDDVMQLILLNCQVPHERINDFRAQMAANRLGVQRFQALCAKYGTDVVMQASDLILDYAERKTRAGIASIPDGIYEHREKFDTSLVDFDLDLCVKIEVKGDEIFFDFAGNPPQVRAGINMVYTALLANVYYAVKTLVDLDVPANSGFHRPIHVVAPEGSIVNCVAPAAVYSRTECGQRLVDQIFAALSKIIPDRVLAACSGGGLITMSGQHPRTGRYYVYNESLGGGYGARPNVDGLDGVHVHTTNTANLPIEALEMEHPVAVECYELVQDSGGAGEFRGGMGIRRRVRVLGHDSTVAVGGSCQTYQPWGLFGGGEGGACHPEQSAGSPPLVNREGVIPNGHSVGVVTAGGGGYGDPRKRDRDQVRADLLDERISERVAREIYGLEI